MQETWVPSLGQDDSLEQEMAPHSGILAWRIPWTEEPGGLQSMGLQRVGHDWVTNTFQYSFMTFCISVVLAVISTLSFFILFIWFSFFFSWWAWLKVYQFFLIFFFFLDCNLFFFPFLFFFKFYFIFKLYNTVLVLPNIKMNLPQVHPRSPSWTLLLPPSPPLPLGHPSAPAPSIQYHASNLQTTNLKNIQATPTAQLQKNKWPNQKMGQRTK